MQKLRKIIILGGTGFIGSHLANKIFKLSEKVCILSRFTNSNHDLKLIPNVEIIQTNVQDERSLIHNFKDCDLVINTIGILNEYNQDNTFEKLHYELTKKISNALAKNKIKRYLHISSLNADVHARSEYLRTKGQAESYLLETTKKFSNITIFRPSIVFGEDDSFFNKFSQILKFAIIFPLACPKSKFMPIYVDDLTEFMMNSINDINTYGQTFDATGPKEYTFQELINITINTLKIKRFVVPLNQTLSRLQARVFQNLPGKIFTMDNYYSLQVDSISSSGYKGTSNLEDIVPRYLNINYKQKRMMKLRKESGRKK